MRELYVGLVVLMTGLVVLMTLSFICWALDTYKTLRIGVVLSIALAATPPLAKGCVMVVLKLVAP